MTVPPLAQSAEFAAALTLRGRPPLRLDDGTLVLCRRLLPGLRLGAITRGPPPTQEALRRRGLHRWPLILSPDAPCPELGETGAVPLIRPLHLAALDLGGGADALRAGLHGKWRNRLCRAEAAGLRVSHRELTAATGQWLLARAEQQQRARGYRGWPRALTLAYAAANPGRARILAAHEGDRPVAAMLFLLHGAGATYQSGVTTDRGRALSAHNLLMWHAMRDLAARGCTGLDLGILDTEGAPGLARFKLGTGARARPLGGTWAWWPPLGRCTAPLAALDRQFMAAQVTGRDPPPAGPCPAQRGAPSRNWTAAPPVG